MRNRQTAHQNTKTSTTPRHSRATAGRPRVFRRPWFETLEDRQLLTVSLPAIADFSVPVLAPVPVELLGSDTEGDKLTYSVSSADPNAVSPILTSSTNPVVKMTVAGYGDMKFQIYKDLVPEAAGHFLDLVNNHSYDNKTIYRIAPNFVIQGGLHGAGSATQFDDQFDPNLRFTRRGVLAMANAGSDTNTSEFFITDVSGSRQLDQRYTIIGFMTEGESVRAALQAASGARDSMGVLTTPITLTSVSVVSSAQSTVLLLSVPKLPANPQPVNVTVTVGDGKDPSVSQTFKVTPVADTDAYANAPPYITKMDTLQTTVNVATPFTIPSADVDRSTDSVAATYTAKLVNTDSSGTVTDTTNPLLAISVNAATGQGTITPSGGLTGVFGLKFGVRESLATAARAEDFQVVPLYINPAAPTGITLLTSSGDGIHTIRNNQTGKLLVFRVTGVQALNQVTVYADGTAIGSATVPAGATTVDVTTDGLTTLTATPHSITAKQILQQQNVRVGNFSASSVALTSQATAALTILVNVSTGVSASVGLYDPQTSIFNLRNTPTTGAADRTFRYGVPGGNWTPLAGDWDGDERDTVGMFQPLAAHFYLRNTNSSGLADLDFGFGDPAQASQYVVLMGDWNGDNIDTVGLYHKASAAWFLRNTNTEGIADLTFGFGVPGSNWTPVVGDWDGDGRDTVGLYDSTTGRLSLRNSTTTGPADSAFLFGTAGSGWTPLAGDWDGNGVDGAGFYQAGAASHFYLRNALTSGNADLDFGFGFTGCLPVVGNWLGVSGLPLLAGGSSPQSAVGPSASLSPGSQSLAPLLSAALAHWAAAGVTIAAPTEIIATDLPGAELGRTNERTLYLDSDAAGHGWFIDPTPAVDEEFAQLAGSNHRQAIDPQAVDRMDLLTVVEHELGHLAGLSDLDASLDSLMSGRLASGVRRRA